MPEVPERPEFGWTKMRLEQLLETMEAHVEAALQTREAHVEAAERAAEVRPNCRQKGSEGKGRKGILPHI